MIQIHRLGMSSNYINIEYGRYVKEQRNSTTEELQRFVEAYVNKSTVYRILFKLVNNYDEPLRVMAARQVLEERIIQK